MEEKKKKETEKNEIITYSTDFVQTCVVHCSNKSVTYEYIHIVCTMYNSIIIHIAYNSILYVILYITLYYLSYLLLYIILHVIVYYM